MKSVSKLKGLQVESVVKNSIAYLAGIRKNDICMAINGQPVEDEIDASFWACEENLLFDLVSKDKPKSIVLQRDPGKHLGIIWKTPELKRCANKCIFCFIDQMAPGLRRSLYIKDEDYRHSFMSGNYMTLTSMNQKTMNKIVMYQLSPLFISVHATDPVVRTLLLGGNKNASKIMDQLEFLTKNGIQLHCQIVVCSGINDGKILRRTVKDLLKFRQGVLSIAVVPVGLTRYHKNNLTPVPESKALTICNEVSLLSDDDRKVNGKRRLFLADEFYCKAQLKIPSHSYYEDYPQIENGVGLIRTMLQEWSQMKKKNNLKKIRGNRNNKKEKILLITGISAKNTLHTVVREMSSCVSLRYTPEIISVENKLFGASVTVAGLLGGKEIIETLQQYHDVQKAILPSVMFNTHFKTLDGYTIEKMEKLSGKKIVCVSDCTSLFTVLKTGRKPTCSAIGSKNR